MKPPLDPGLFFCLGLVHARPYIPEPYDALSGANKLIPVHDEGDILVLIVGHC